ncbi:MAG: 23S rRNA (adenine(2503)-C(2))-methyltransferase RlmN [Thermoguttaceae bacterium]|nr:23S rRNA (adenine(2503)-C(2))-methyltransferase RlmN [Thermoguttaceae bacterium]MDW8037803.1 23S rRNA (adenine(2503)-C(2))-methyltransferase RlmN [Thermoguttaceae bacterium]
MEHLLDWFPDRLQSWLAERGQPSYRAGQIRQWILRRRVDQFEQMTDLPKQLRAQLAAEFFIWSSRVAAHQKADDGTEKLLLELLDGERIECVLLRDDRHHRTACISTQVGCGMGCRFCASGLDGLIRNLTTGEILEQLLQLDRLLPAGERLTHIVVMGMGEPLANLDRLLPALASATDSQGLGIGARRVTISTVGLPAGIVRLAEAGVQYHLAISLHAPDDALRNQLVPSNRNVGIKALLEAADQYFQKTGRRITYEYVLIGGVNDQPRHARALAALLRGRKALVNLIVLNPVPELSYRPPAQAEVERFVQLLETGGINVHVRYRKGDQIEAACGQLRRRTDEHLPTGPAGLEKSPQTMPTGAETVSH